MNEKEAKLKRCNEHALLWAEGRRKKDELGVFIARVCPGKGWWEGEIHEIGYWDGDQLCIILNTGHITFPVSLFVYGKSFVDFDISEKMLNSLYKGKQCRLIPGRKRSDLSIDGHHNIREIKFQVKIDGSWETNFLGR